MIRVWLLLIAVLVAGSKGPAADWAQWRGPFFNGSTTETNLPPRLSRADHLAWSTPLPGRSGATPAIWGDHVFVSSPDESKNLLLLSIDARSGAVRWQREVAVGDRVVGKNNMASPSPIADGQRVYILYGTSDLAAFDFEGREVWRRRLRDEFGAFANMFLYGASPLLLDDRLYVPIIQRNPPTYGYSVDLIKERKSWLLCLDAADGRVIWRQERLTEAREEAMEAYTTPLPLDGPTGRELIVVGANCVTAHDPRSGAETWRYSGLNRSANPGGRIVPGPVAGAGLLFACGPKREMIVALQPPAATPAPGSAFTPEIPVRWSTNQFIPDVPTPLFYQGRLFVLDGDRQVMNCYEPATGRVIWQGRLGVRELFYASPTGADGRIYCLGEEGTLVVLSAGERFEILSSIPFGDGPTMSSVAISRGRFFLRTGRQLLCLTASKPNP